MKKGAPGGVAAVERALSILDAFGDGDASLTLAAIAARTGLYKSTVLRLIASLEHFGHMRRLDNGTYRLGPSCFRLGSLYQRAFNLGDVVMPVLRHLTADTQESASFYVRDGDHRVCLHRTDSPRPVRVSVHEGDRRPLDRGAAGRVLLAFGGTTPGSGLDAVRRACLSISFGEVTAETAAIASPVFGVNQTLIGAINLSGPRERFRPPLLPALSSTTLSAAAELTRQLGGDSSVFPADAAAA